jgi:Arginase family
LRSRCCAEWSPGTARARSSTSTPTLDTWDTYFNAPLTQGTVLRRAFEDGLLIEDHSMHVGIRGPIYDALDLQNDRDFGFKTIRTSELMRIGLEAAAQQIRERLDDLPVYLSVDIDVLDPAFAPGTGTPESGGLLARELLGLLRSLDGLNLVGADVVEVAPAYDHAEITTLAAATVVFDIASLMARTGDPDRLVLSGDYRSEDGEVVAQVGCEARGEVVVISHWVDLGHGEGVAVRGQYLHQLYRVTGSDATRLVSPRARCMRRVDCVDVEAEEHMVGTADALENLVSTPSPAVLDHLQGRDLRQS